MAVDLIRYDLLAQDALRGVVKKVLVDVASRGLPGDHHFFISFHTRADGVKISARLREKYPEELTIVLQHQFWDLIVGDDQFEVGVSFNGVPERLTVPFAAIKGFFDPSVQFGLQFELVAEAKPLEKDSSQDTDAGDAPGSEVRNTPRSVPRGAASEPEEMRPTGTSVPASRKSPPTPAVTGPVPASEEKGGAEVVRLDKFRKK
jgi:uncharacterized protein